jgi:hypothetical protein
MMDSLGKRATAMEQRRRENVAGQWGGLESIFDFVFRLILLGPEVIMKVDKGGKETAKQLANSF